MLWLALGVQGIWLAMKIAQQHGSLHGLLYALFASLGFAALAALRGRVRWLAIVLRMFIGYAFLSAVCDRLGLFGGPGTPGVAWGNFHNFVIYTGQVNAFLPAAIIPALAVVASVCEGGLGLAMLLGIRPRIAAAGSSVLLFLFALAMTVSLGLRSQFPYAVYVLAAGSWVLATMDTSWRGTRKTSAPAVAG